MLSSEKPVIVINLKLTRAAVPPPGTEPCLIRLLEGLPDVDLSSLQRVFRHIPKHAERHAAAGLDTHYRLVVATEEAAEATLRVLSTNPEVVESAQRAPDVRPQHEQHSREQHGRGGPRPKSSSSQDELRQLTETGVEREPQKLVDVEGELQMQLAISGARKQCGEIVDMHLHLVQWIYGEIPGTRTLQERERETETQRERQTDRQRERERERQRARERDR